MKLTEIARGNQKATKMETRVSLDDAISGFMDLRKQFLANRPSIIEIVACGSVRRYKETCGDLDVVVVDGGAAENHAHIEKWEVNGIPAQVHFCHPANIGAMKLFTTGCAKFNLLTRVTAKRLGYSLNRYGLWRVTAAGKIRISAVENDILEILGLSEFSDPRSRVKGKVRESWQNDNLIHGELS